jgi:hypothetical protein
MQQTSQEHFSQSFALQFISLILFVLIFTIWSFLPKLQEKHLYQENKQEVVNAAISENPTLYKIELQKKYFADDSFELNDVAWSPMREMIFQHDLSLHVQMKTLSDARMVFERLIESGFPEESILVEADPSISTEQLMVIAGASPWR